MLKTDVFPDAHLGTLTEQINNWIGDMIRTGQLPPAKNGSAAENAAEYELGEQFLMVSMKDPEVYAAVESFDRDLGELVTLTGRRHHQLKYKQSAVAYARSLIDDNEALCQLFVTKLAPSVQAAIAWLDAHEDEFANGIWRVRLLTIPTFHTHAFLIQKVEEGSDVPISDSIVYVVSAPPWLNKLPSEQTLTTREFLNGFKGKSPIIGVNVRRRASN